ncbi:MAG: hypothetical protein V3V95_01645 [Thermodesulfobacteriota bacterium]
MPVFIKIRFKRSLLSSLFIGAAIFVLLLSLPDTALAAQVRVAVIPWTVNGPEDSAYLKGAMTDMLSSRIGSSDIVEIVRFDEVKRALAEDVKTGKIDEAAAIKIGKNLKADYLIYGSISVLGESVSLDASLVNIANMKSSPFYSSGEGVSSVVWMAESVSRMTLEAIGLETGTVKADLSYTGKFADNNEEGEIKSSKEPVILDAEAGLGKPLPVGEGAGKKETVKVVTRTTGASILKRRSANIPGFLVSMTSADMDRDGTDEIFLVREASVIIANYGLKGLHIIQELKAPDKAQNLFVSSGDTDGDGFEEVFLARLNNGKPSSVRIDYIDGKYVVQEAPGLDRLVRAINIQGEGAKLIAQGFRIGSGFFRKIKKLKKDKDGYVEDGELNLPREVISRGLASFQIFDLDSDGSNEIVSLGNKGSLRVYKAVVGGKGEIKEYWRSPETFGGSLNELLKPDESGDEHLGTSDDGFYINSGIEYGDFDSDGVVELMVKRNIATGLAKIAKKVRTYKSSSLHRLSWNVALMDEEWKTKVLSGYISDFVVADLDGDGTLEVTILIVELEGKILKKKNATSYLLTYSII